MKTTVKIGKISATFGEGNNFDLEGFEVATELSREELQDRIALLGELFSSFLPRQRDFVIIVKDDAEEDAAEPATTTAEGSTE